MSFLGLLRFLYIFIYTCYNSQITQTFLETMYRVKAKNLPGITSLQFHLLVVNAAWIPNSRDTFIIQRLVSSGIIKKEVCP